MSNVHVHFSAHHHHAPFGCTYQHTSSGTCRTGTQAGIRSGRCLADSGTSVHLHSGVLLFGTHPHLDTERHSREIHGERTSARHIFFFQLLTSIFLKILFPNVENDTFYSKLVYFRGLSKAHHNTVVWGHLVLLAGKRLRKSGTT